MRDEIARFNTGVGVDLVGLKVGLHAGACLAVTLNERRDYFGQTVNIAARVQALSGANEITLTDEILSVPGVAELLTGLETEPSAAQLKGIAGDVRVYRVLARSG